MEETKEAACEEDEHIDAKHKKKMIDRIFPPKYDFHGMLRKQADLTTKAIQAFVKWLHDGAKGEAE